MGKTIGMFGCKEDADKFVLEHEIEKRFGDVKIREILSNSTNLYRVNISQSAYKKYMDYLHEEKRFER